MSVCVCVLLYVSLVAPTHLCFVSLVGVRSFVCLQFSLCIFSESVPIKNDISYQ